MDPSGRWRQVESLYHAARTRSPEARAVFLAEACAGDERLRREVESLLAQSVSADGVLDGHALAFAAQMMNGPGANSLVGRRLDIYQVLAPLGAGGMGEVYRARDTRLHRDVALKVLPREFTTDPDRLRPPSKMRPVRWPRSTIRNIGAIYGVEDLETGGLSAGIVFRAPAGARARGGRHAGGANPKARRRGGPGSVWQPEGQRADDRTADRRRPGGRPREGHYPPGSKAGEHQDYTRGRVKVLDFGIAKRMSHCRRWGLEVISGTLRGTARPAPASVSRRHAAYMSPEQARGHAVDTDGRLGVRVCAVRVADGPGRLHSARQ